MRILSIAAYLGLGLVQADCTFDKEKQDTKVQPTSTTIPINNTEEKGALEDGKWEVVFQKEEVSLYKVELNGKKITVIADWHTELGRKELLKVLEEVKKDPKNWALLIEGLDYIKEITKEIKDNVGLAKSLPHGGDGINYLIRSRKVSPEDMALAYGLARLDRVARGINVKEGGYKTNPLEEICNHIEKSFKEETGIILRKKRIKEIILSAASTPKNLESAVNKSNEIFLRMAVNESDKMITKVVQKTLKGNHKNYLIHMGEGHLRSLIRTGPLAKYTEKLLDKVKTDAKFVQKALAASK